MIWRIRYEGCVAIRFAWRSSCSGSSHTAGHGRRTVRIGESWKKSAAPTRPSQKRGVESRRIAVILSSTPSSARPGRSPSPGKSATRAKAILAVGWFGFNVMSAQTLDKISGLVAVNSLMAMVGGTLVAVLMGRNDPGFAYNGPLAGLVAVCAGSDLMHPAGALVVGAVAGAIFVQLFTLTQNRWKIDDVLGVWPLHGLCGAWGGIACGLFGQTALGGMGGVSLASQTIGTLMAVGWALLGGFTVYGLIKQVIGLRLSQEEEFEGADLSIHKIGATPDREVSW